MSKQSETKLAHRRFQMLEFGEALGNISEACRKMHISRSHFYTYKKRYHEQGLEGLKDLPPIHKSHPQTTAPEVVEEMQSGFQPLTMTGVAATPAPGCRVTSPQE